jgi:hypothetical protein
MTDARVRGALERRLVETLRTKAAHLNVSDLPFDRHSPAITDMVTTRARARRPIGRAILIGAVVLVVAISTVSVILTRSTSRVTTRGNVATSGTGSSLSGIDAPVLAPTSVPEGLRLWWISPGSGSSPPLASQLFGTLRPDGAPDPGLLVEMNPTPPGSSVGGRETVRVRGVNAAVGPSKDAGAAPTEIAWIEANVEVRVTIRGMSVDQAVATLDALRARTDNLLEGFDPASAPPDRQLLGEQIGANNDKPRSVHAQFDYAKDEPTAGATPSFSVRTDTAHAYPGYLRVWIAGSRAEDGAAVEFDPGFGAVVAWPDGRQSEALIGAVSDAGELERIARSVKLVDVDHVNALYDGIQARLARLPLLSAVDLPSGRLELRGNGEPSTVCLRLASSRLACANPWTTPLTSPPTPTGFTGGVTVDGQWLVFTAAKAPVSMERPRDVARPPSEVDLKPERATAGEWQLALVAVPNDLDTVQVSVSTGANTTSGVTVRRPKR